MTLSKNLAVATFAAAIAGVSVPASAYERNYDGDYNKRSTATSARGSQHIRRNTDLVIPPHRHNTKVVIVTRDRDDDRAHGKRSHRWDRFFRWHRHGRKHGHH